MINRGGSMMPQAVLKGI